LSSSFNTALQLALRTSDWVAVVLAVLVVAITAAVAGIRHTGVETAQAAVPDSAQVAQTGHDAQEPAVSRGGFRRDTGGSARHAAAEVIDSGAPVERKPPVSTGPLAASDAAETVASAVASSSNVPGQCLGWSRQQAEIPSRYPDAATAWTHATGRHRGDPVPPEGAAVYWTGGSSGHGHVAISLGRGKVRSTDAAGEGSVATVPLRSITRDWHLEYAGWADSINGYTIPGVASA
jgi:hypothetical protein